ncbi:MAG: cupredoxin domain-containing protein [Candidatus Caldarchaeales archaeon]|jgi:hypothetical protein
MRVRVKLLILTVVLAVLGAFLVQGLVRAQPREHVVVIQSGALIPPENWSGGLVFDNRYFSPSNLTVKVGDVVTWINRDSVTHTVTDLSAQKAFDQMLGPGQRFSYRFERRGVYVYYCVVHPWKGGEVRVE